MVKQIITFSTKECDNNYWTTSDFHCPDIPLTDKSQIIAGDSYRAS